VEQAHRTVAIRQTDATTDVLQHLFLQPASPRIQASLANALKQVSGELPVAFLAVLVRRIEEDAANERLAWAELLAHVFQVRCHLDDKAFDSLTRIDGGAEVLRRYVARCRDSVDASLSAWADRQGILKIPGLRGQYFEGTNFAVLSHEQLDSSINITSTAYPFADGRRENLSVRWTGYLLITDPGLYTLILTSDDGMRLWINERLLMDDWTMHPATEGTVTIDLGSGLHALKVEHMQGTGEGTVKLEWTGPGIPRRNLVTGIHVQTEPWPDMHAP
jgi:hypothetical protein